MNLYSTFLFLAVVFLASVSTQVLIRAISEALHLEKIFILRTPAYTKIPALAPSTRTSNNRFYSDNRSR